MSIPVDITIRHIERTPAIESNIRQKAEKMSQFHDRIESLKVVVDMEQNQHHKGKLYNVMIEGLVPGKKLIVNRNPDENLYVAIRDAFNALRQQLKDHSRKIKGTVKNHQTTLRGTVARMYTDYGFIESLDGTEYYFHKSVVANGGFEGLQQGVRVTFLETLTSDSLQAAHVIKVNNHIEGETFLKAG